MASVKLQQKHINAHNTRLALGTAEYIGKQIPNSVEIEKARRAKERSDRYINPQVQEAFNRFRAKKKLSSQQQP